MRSGELEGEYAFGVVRQLFEPTLADEEMRARALAGAAGPARSVLGLTPRPGDEPVEDASFASLHGLYWLTVDLSEDVPLLLTVDDLHWCDRPSLRFLAYLVRRLEGLPVLVVCSRRPTQPGEDPALVAEIAGDPLAATLHPAPLSEPAVRDLVRERLGEGSDDVFSNACHAASGGNPLLLQELLKTLDGERVSPDAAHVGVVADLGPRAVSRAVLLRLARLPQDVVSMARAIAVRGDGAELSAVAMLAGLDETSAGRGAAELLRAEILQAEPPLAFAHPLVAAAVYRDVPPGVREILHERAARLLAERGAPVEQVAAHLLAIPARGDEWVVETLRRAARTALGQGAADSAAAYLGRALAEPPPPDQRSELLLELGRAEALTSGPAAGEHLREA